MKSQIVFASKNETEVLGFNIARCNEDEFDENQLKSEIFEGKYDLCRLKIPAENEMVSSKLYKVGIPFFFSGSIRRYKTFINEKPQGEFLYPDMTYEMYDGTQDELLFELLKGTWGTYPLGYYRTPFVCELVDKEAEIQSVFKFYKKSNLNSLNPENSIMFMNHKGNYVGFFALNKIGGGLESHIGGIVEPYRKGGYFLDMLRYIKIFCVENNLDFFAFGARNENAYVQKIFQDVGFKAIGSENVFHLIPMLSLSQIPKKYLVLSKNDFQTIIESANKFIGQYFIKYKITSVQISELDAENETENIGRIVLSMPVKTTKSFLAVILMIDDDNAIKKSYYIAGEVAHS